MSRPPWLLALFTTQRRDLVARATRVTGDAGAAEDVVQEAWIRLDGLASDHVVADRISYLRRVVSNLAMDEYRRRVRRGAVEPPEYHEEVASEVVDCERAIIAAEELALVTAALEQMPARMRRAVELHRIAGAPLREIADDLGVSVTTAHTLVTDGVERCRRCLDRRSN